MELNASTFWCMPFAIVKSISKTMSSLSVLGSGTSSWFDAIWEQLYYSSLFIVAMTTILFLAGCSSSAMLNPQEKAFEVAHGACSMFRRMGIEQVNNDEAVLKSGGASTLSKEWVVRLTGTKQLESIPSPTIEISNASGSSITSSEWLYTCQVSIYAADWHVISTHQTRAKISP